MCDPNAVCPRVVPVFPLPDLVLLPGQVQGLHIFEPRYRQMTADLLQGDRWLAIALLKPGFEPSYFTPHAPIHGTLGVGRVVAAEARPDGRYDILVRGSTRARLVRENDPRPYRVAEVETLQDDDMAAEGCATLRHALECTVREELAVETDLRECCLHLFSQELSLGAVADVIASGLPLAPEIRQKFLETTCVRRRVESLLSYVRTYASVTRTSRRIRPDPCSDLN